MRKDMAQVIVERPRIKPWRIRKDRRVTLEDLPTHEGMRRGHALRGERKLLNENLTPLRRYLERQVGRPWNKVYSEIAQHLHIDSTVQQHVRDHIQDFVAVKPRRVSHGVISPAGLWWQPLYVDPRTGLLCRTDRFPEEKRRARSKIPAAPLDRITLSKHAELRLISALWYFVELAHVPKPEYRLRQIVSRPVRDVVTRQWIPAGPQTDDPKGWQRYRRIYPSSLYAISKRVLSRQELRRYGVCNPPPDGI